MRQPEATTILIVEDDEPLRRSMQDMLELSGYRTLTARNGAEALAVARDRFPTIIITDLNMPTMDGYELLGALQREEALKMIPVIVITAKADRLALRRGMEAGASDFITKPFSEDELMHSIQARLDHISLIDEMDAFAHTVAHDLRNPLATLTGRLEILSMSVGRADPADLAHQVDEALKSSSRLGSIIDELMILAGVRRQAVPLSPLDMGAIVAEALERLEEPLRLNEVAVVTPSSWPCCAGHAPWVAHLWTNYIGNAAKYAGPRSRVALGGDVTPDKTRARFWVQDNGPGLSPEAQARIFVPFTRISQVRATGHGLGLSIVRRIAEKLGGTAGVESTLGQGCRFWFELPVADAGLKK